MQNHDPSEVTNDQTESNTEEIRLQAMSESLTIEEEDIYDDVIPSNLEVESPQLNYSNNRSEVKEEDIYDDVIPANMASVGVLRPLTNGDEKLPAKPKASADTNGQTKVKKNRPTNLDMPTQYVETKGTAVKVAAIIEKLSNQQPGSLLSYASDNKVKPERPKHASSPIPKHDGSSSAEQTIYEVDSPQWKGKYQGQNGGYNSEGVGQSPSHHVTHFDALECGGDDSGPYEDLHFDEGEQGL